ncbi:MAG: YcaO-like family protein [Gammaproteobacteria bacterium]|nr:YcaO-like family protein [Gammaproteobacteria bacterium]
MQQDKLTENNYFNLGCTIRACTPEITFEKIAPIMKKIGISRVANVTGLDNIGIPVAICIRPNSKHLSVSQGKGISWQLAQISSIMESIEGYHSENPTHPELIGIYTQLQNHLDLLDPYEVCKGFFEYDVRNLELGWVKGTDLITRRVVYVPHGAICLDSSKLHIESTIFNPSSNGLASGNTIIEALLHGLYEIIERDALSNWKRFSKNDKYVTQIELCSIQSDINRELIDKFLKAGQKIRIWDITSAINVPAYYCTITDSDNIKSLGTFYGSGAHLYKEIALSRALLEAAQSRLTFITGTRDEIFPMYYKNKSVSQPEGEHNGNLSFYSNQEFLNLSFTEDLNEVISRLLSKKKSKIVFVNHTKEDLNIPVVHIFVSGMNSD